MKLEKFELFIKLMKLTTTPVDGECLSAIRKANNMLAEANIDWDDLLKSKVKIIQGKGSEGAVSGRTSSASGVKKYSNEQQINEMFNAVFANTSRTSSFYSFLNSLKDWFDTNGYLTEKQYHALRNSYERIH